MSRPLKIGYDAKRAFFNETGLGNYSRNLIDAMLAQYPDNQYVLYTPKKPRSPFLMADTRVKFHRPHRRLHRLLPSIWRSYWMGRSIATDKLDIYHGLSHELPRNIGQAGVPSVVTMHDLIYERFPQLYPWIDRQLYADKYRFSARAADHIIAISQQTKADLMHYYQVPEEKITVVYQNCNPTFGITRSPEEIAHVKHHYHIHGKYMLYVGAITERKQVLALVQAFHQAKLDDVKLVLVGHGDAYREQILSYIKEHQLANQVFSLAHVDAKNLPALYQGASLFVYPSLFEGFGIPIIEAMTSGVPVITTTGSCFAEAGGPDSLYVEPGDITGLAANIRRVMEDEPLSTRMRENGKAYATQFSAVNFAQNTMAVYQRLLG